MVLSYELYASNVKNIRTLKQDISPRPKYHIASIYFHIPFLKTNVASHNILATFLAEWRMSFPFSKKNMQALNPKRKKRKISLHTTNQVLWFWVVARCLVYIDTRSICFRTWLVSIHIWNQKQMHLYVPIKILLQDWEIQITK